MAAAPKRATAKPEAGAGKPNGDVWPGDSVYIKHPKLGHMPVDVLAVGKDGFTGRCAAGKRHGCGWDVYVGHRARMHRICDLVDEGADGAIVRDELGRTHYIAGGLPEEPEEPADPKQDDPILDGKALAKAQAPSEKRTLYVSRRVLNGAEIGKWFRDQGCSPIAAPEDMHVTIALSKELVDWNAVPDHVDELRIPAGGGRQVAQFDKGATVLKFHSRELTKRWNEFRGAGASWDHPNYQPHVTVSYGGKGFDKAKPFPGVILLGPERFKEVKSGWRPTLAKAEAPTEAQIRAGNYPKLHARWNGLDISIENPKGSTRSGTDRGGHKWSTKMRHDYGYIRRTMGVDGDQFDVLLGPDLDGAAKVYVVTTAAAPDFKKVDEQKALIGFASAADARAAFATMYDDPRFFASMKTMDPAEFKVKVLATKDKPALLNARFLFFKAAIPGGAAGDLFTAQVNVHGYSRGGQYVRAYPAARRKRADHGRAPDLFPRGIPPAKRKRLPAADLAKLDNGEFHAATGVRVVGGGAQIEEIRHQIASLPAEHLAFLGPRVRYVECHAGPIPDDSGSLGWCGLAGEGRCKIDIAGTSKDFFGKEYPLVGVGKTAAHELGHAVDIGAGALYVDPAVISKNVLNVPLISALLVPTFQEEIARAPADLRRCGSYYLATYWEMWAELYAVIYTHDGPNPRGFFGGYTAEEAREFFPKSIAALKAKLKEFGL